MKKIDWLGLIILGIYLFVFLALILCAFLLQSPTCYGIATVYAFVAACFIYPTLCYTRKMTSKPIVQKAMLAAKTIKCKKYYDEIGCETQRPLYFLTFRTSDNNIAEMYVTKDDFDRLTENTAGLLTYKKYRNQFYYIDFAADRL